MQSPKHPRSTSSLPAFLTSLVLVAVTPAQTPLDRAVHIANRAGFGPSPATVAKILGPNSSLIDAQNYINDQLDFAPANQWHGTGQAEVTAALQGLPIPIHQGDPAKLPGTPQVASPLPNAEGAVAMAQVAFATYSEWQLREVMAQFWDRHFNTHLFASKFYFQGLELSATGNDIEEDDYAAWFEYEASKFYRAHAFDSFETLLKFMARDPSMVIYLNLTSNTKAAPNEDFARELLELYTMGPERVVINRATGAPITPVVVLDNYTQSDVITAAKIFSGWTVTRSPNAPQFGFEFVPGDHDTTPKQMFGGSFNIFGISGPNGVDEGLALLSHLTGRTETKQFICSKLIREFLGDSALDTTQGESLLAASMAAWGSNGNMKEVLRTILTSTAFLDDVAFQRNRHRIPFKQVVAPMRALGASSINQTTTHLGSTVNLTMSGPQLVTVVLGQPIFGHPSPDGYPSESLEQIGSAATGARVNYIHDLAVWPALGNLTDFVPALDLVAIHSQAGSDAAFIDAISERLFGTIVSSADKAGALAVLNDIKTLPLPVPVPAPVYLAAGAVAIASQTQNGIE